MNKTTTYQVEIIEYLVRIVKVEAASKDEAYHKVRKMYKNEEIVLDEDDYLLTKFKEFKDE